MKKSSRSPVTSECDITHSPNSSTGINQSNGTIRLVLKSSAQPVKNFIQVKNRSPENTVEPQIPIFKINKNDISPEPHKQVQLQPQGMRILSTNLVNLNPNGNSNKPKNQNSSLRENEREGITNDNNKPSKIIKLIKTSPDGNKEMGSISKVSPVPKKMVIFKKLQKSQSPEDKQNQNQKISLISNFKLLN